MHPSMLCVVASQWILRGRGLIGSGVKTEPVLTPRTRSVREGFPRRAWEPELHSEREKIPRDRWACKSLLGGRSRKELGCGENAGEPFAPREGRTARSSSSTFPLISSGSLGMFRATRRRPKGPRRRGGVRWHNG